jgi:hypothetical protein
VDVTFTNLSSPLSADHFHAPAGRGTNTGVVYGLQSITTSLGATNGTIKGSVTLTNNAYGGKDVCVRSRISGTNSGI